MIRTCYSSRLMTLEDATQKWEDTLLRKKSSGNFSPEPGNSTGFGAGATASSESGEGNWIPKNVWEMLEPDMRRSEQYIAFTPNPEPPSPTWIYEPFGAGQVPVLNVPTTKVQGVDSFQLCRDWEHADCGMVSRSTSRQEGLYSISRSHPKPRSRLIAHNLNPAPCTTASTKST